MKTITVASAKGGSGKSTVASALAVQAVKEGAKAAVLDLNYDQGSLTAWWTVRGRPAVPYLDTAEGRISERLAGLAKTYDWAIIDTPPLDVELIEGAVAIADAVLIPVRCGFFDLAAAETVVEMCREHKRPYAFVLNAVDSRYKQGQRLREQMIMALGDGLGPRFETEIKYKQAWIMALATGKSGPEIDRELQPLIAGLWAETKALVEKGAAQ